VPRWAPPGLRLLGLARTEGRKAQARRHKETGANARRPATSPASRNTATGTATCRWAACRTCTCWNCRQRRTQRHGKVRDLFEGSHFELTRADPGVEHFDVSPDGRHVVFAFDPASKSAATAATRWPRWRCAAARRGSSRRTWPGTSARRATAPTATASPSPPATRPCATPCRISWPCGSAKPATGKWSAPSGTTRCTRRCTGKTTARRCCSAPSRKAAATCGASTCPTGAPRWWWPAAGCSAFDKAAGTLVTLADSGPAPGPPARPPAGCRAAPHRDLQRQLMATLAMGRVEEVWVQGAEGDDVQMWLVYPPGFDPKKKYPVLHNIHGGPHTGPGQLALPLEHAGLCGAGLCGGQRQLPRLIGLWPRLPGQHHAPLGRTGTAGHRSRHRLAAEEIPGSTRSACSPPVAATAASWWRG
jgi:hypothetical protein